VFYRPNSVRESKNRRKALDLDALTLRMQLALKGRLVRSFFAHRG
jgi:hypothetical protein